MIFRQKDAKALGDEGCYFFCLVYIAEKVLGKSVDAFALFDEAKRQGWMGEDCYMANPAAMLASVTGAKCSIRKSTDFNEKLSWNEWDVWCYCREATGVTYYHFVVMDGSGNVAYDPLETSNTVAKGYPSSRRIITVNA